MPKKRNPCTTINPADVPAIKGMLARKDVQSDIAAYYGTNGGRICEINTGQTFADIKMTTKNLPPPGPYLAARSAFRAKETLCALRDLIDQALADISTWETARAE